MKSNTHPALAIMNIDKGEEITGMWVTPHIAGTGIYKLLAKKCIDKKYEWAHFVQRDNGMKENVYRGKVENIDQLKLVLEIMNKNLENTFGKHINLQTAKYDTFTLDGAKVDDTVN